jgi:signal transduction histidine kinase
VKAIAEAHGGRVSVESTAAHGTRFEVVLLRDARPLDSALAKKPEVASSS